PVSDKVVEHTWDHRNRLTRVTFYDNTANVTKTIDYVYDAFDQLIKRTEDVDGALGTAPIEQAFFIYDAGQVVLEFEKTGTGNVAASDLAHRYLWGPGVDMLLADEQVASLTSAGQTYWAMADNVGSVRDVVDSSGKL